MNVHGEAYVSEDVNELRKLCDTACSLHVGFADLQAGYVLAGGIFARCRSSRRCWQRALRELPAAQLA